jgi:glycosyltransferase involved in cell wall biosynthesis
VKIIIPALLNYLRHGGVAQFICNFYSGIKDDHFSEDELHDLQGEILKTPIVTVSTKWQSVARKVRLLINIPFFKYKVKNYDLVFLNPSLGKNALTRDLYYAQIAINEKVPFIVFIHGWNWEYAATIEKNLLKKQNLVKTISQALAVFVLCNEFKQKLVSWGVPEDKVLLEYTTVNDDFIPDESVNRSSNSAKKILFLARVVKEKGIFEALAAFKIHLQHSPDSIFMVGGTGPDLEKAKAYVKDRHIANVQFHGFVEGEAKKKLLEDADIFLFPTYYPEGMPICIFEAMAYGQFVITRPVGGVADYFTSAMGVTIESKDPAEFANALNSAVSDVDKLNEVAIFNHKFVSENCKSSVVAKRILSRVAHLNGKP